jgi:hypothetical protein
MVIVRDRRAQLLAAVQVVKPILEPHGFAFAVESEGQGSGGHFASGSFRTRDRRLELHFRDHLGLVTYHIGDDSLDHETYMRLLKVYGRNLYPGFPENPLDSFKHLASDLQNYCADFLSGDGKQFKLLAGQFRQDPRMFKGIP